MNSYDAWGKRRAPVVIVFPEQVMADLQAKADQDLGRPTSNLEQDITPQEPMAEKKGAVVVLKCRTAREALLVASELERENIIAVLPETKHWGSKDYVEVQVSAEAYTSAKELQAVVEFRYFVLRAEQPLPFVGKFVVLLLGVMFIPGIVIFTGLMSWYRAHGYERMARQARLCFLLGLLCFAFLVGLDGLRVRPGFGAHPHQAHNLPWAGNPALRTGGRRAEIARMAIDTFFAPGTMKTE